ncbi:MAG TPA: DUF116 domain-containing protein [Patescibacteria group bacterium]|nr:DUF116 domain-containing protein [Patescibacteria group bacterium]
MTERRTDVSGVVARDRRDGMVVKSQNQSPDRESKRVLGDEWLDWREGGAETEIREGKRTFLSISLAILIGLISLIFLLWYLILPRFELYGGYWAAFLTTTVVVIAVFFVTWYALLLFALFSRNSYLNICLRKGTNLFFALLPLSMKLAGRLGISRDRVGHSFIRVSNLLVKNAEGDGQVLALLPRCLTGELKEKVKSICAAYPDVVAYTAPGGTVARKIIRETKPRAIVAVACERDLISGIQDIAPKIPVIGIPNSRPEGPCRETRIDLVEFRSALKFFSDKS